MRLVPAGSARAALARSARAPAVLARPVLVPAGHAPGDLAVADPAVADPARAGPVRQDPRAGQPDQEADRWGREADRSRSRRGPATARYRAAAAKQPAAGRCRNHWRWGCRSARVTRPGQRAAGLPHAIPRAAARAGQPARHTRTRASAAGEPEPNRPRNPDAGRCPRQRASARASRQGCIRKNLPDADAPRAASPAFRPAGQARPPEPVPALEPSAGFLAAAVRAASVATLAAPRQQAPRTGPGMR